MAIPLLSVIASHVATPVRKFFGFILLALCGGLLSGCESVAEGIAEGLFDSMIDTAFDAIPPSKVNTTEGAHFTKRGSPYP